MFYISNIYIDGGWYNFEEKKMSGLDSMEYSEQLGQLVLNLPENNENSATHQKKPLKKRIIFASFATSIIFLIFMNFIEVIVSAFNWDTFYCIRNSSSTSLK